jgi:hypothetical protein
MAEQGGWTITDHLLALNIEQTHGVSRSVLASIPQPANRQRRLPKPLVIPRPGVRREPRRMNPGEFFQVMRKEVSGG